MSAAPTELLGHYRAAFEAMRAGHEASAAQRAAACDRVATLAPNTHQHLEQYYAVPQVGAVIVPLL